jgi:DNA-binding MarR family transcriptional regulator
MIQDDRLIYLVFRAQHQLLTYLETELTKADIVISTKQSGVLFLLRDSNLQTMSELSQTLAIEGSAMTGLVDRLERYGFVTREINPDDRRQFRIGITKRGLEELSRAEKVIRKTNEFIKSGFSAQEIDAFKKVLNSFFKKFKFEK